MKQDAVIEQKKSSADKAETVKEAATGSYYEAVGRRKSATARVRLYVVKDEGMTISGVEVKKGGFLINNRSAEAYFPGEIMKKFYVEPFRTTNTMNRFVISGKIIGGGLHSQLEAFILASSRALQLIDKDKFRPILKKRGFLTRDSRIRQRRKPNTGGKARRQKQSPKR